MNNIDYKLYFLFTASTPCQPNPCFNDGQCQETSPTTFTCDCTGTLYTGKLCNTGVIEIPKTLPQMVVNEESINVIVYARPTVYLTITPRSNSELSFNPSVIRIEVPQTSATFKMVASRTGVFDVEFEIGGQNDFDFEKPAMIQVHVFQNKTSLLIDMNLEDIIETASETLKLTDGILLHSSCIKDSKRPSGFVSVESENLTTLPLSVVGLYQSTLDRFTRDKVLDPTEEIDSYLKTRKVKDSNKCLLLNSTSTGGSFTQRIEYVIQNNFFQISVLRQITSSFPVWFELRKLNTGPEYETSSLMTKVVSREELQKTKCFKPLVKDALIFPLEGCLFNIYHSNSPVSFKIMGSKIDFQKRNRICYFTDYQLGQTNILSDSPIRFITDLSPDHIVVKLSSHFISVSSKREAMMLDIEMKMKSFDGKFKTKSMLFWKESIKVRIFSYTFKKITYCFAYAFHAIETKVNCFNRTKKQNF